MQRLILLAILVATWIGTALPAHGQNAQFYNHRGVALDKKGEHDKAIADFDQAIRLDPKLSKAYNNRGLAWESKQQYDKAIADFTQAIRLDPNFAAYYINRGSVSVEKGDFDEAIADYDQAIRLAPHFAVAYNNRGNAWKYKGEHDKAIADYHQSISLDPAYGAAYDNRGNAWFEKGEYDKAIADYKQSITLEPDDDSAYAHLAWLQATCPDARHRDKQKAIENAKKAYALDGGKGWNAVDTLAAACAENGDFKEACAWEQKAITMAPESDKQECRARLELYKQSKPYRDKVKR